MSVDAWGSILGTLHAATGIDANAGHANWIYFDYPDNLSAVINATLSSSAGNVTVAATGSVSGLITSGGNISSISAGAGINATASAHGSINALHPGHGNLAGSFTAVTGSLPDITCDGSITAALTAGTTIGNLTASQNIAATVLA